jgi:hypothetical protein
MKTITGTALAIMALAIALGAAPRLASAQESRDPSGKTCRMEKQCRWENFKKICIYVKVCR